MKNKIIHNISMILVPIILILLILVITYMGATTYKISHEAQELNYAVKTSSDIAEIAADAPTIHAFQENVGLQIGSVTVSENKLKIDGKYNLVIEIKTKVTEETYGSTIFYKITVRDESKKIYSLNTQKYVAHGKQGDFQ